MSACHIILFPYINDWFCRQLSDSWKSLLFPSIVRAVFEKIMKIFWSNLNNIGCADLNQNLVWYHISKKSYFTFHFSKIFFCLSYCDSHTHSDGPMAENWSIWIKEPQNVCILEKTRILEFLNQSQYDYTSIVLP